MLRRIPAPLSVTLSVAAVVLLAGICQQPGPVPGPALCFTPLADFEPLCNASLADSEWGTSHRTSYAQASAAAPGPAASDNVTASHLVLPGVPISLDFTRRYPDGGYAIWGSPLGLDGAVAKIDFDTWTVIDSYIPAEREVSPPDYTAGISGAYNAVDADGHFIVGRTRFLEVYADSIPGDRMSPIGLVKREFLPDAFFCRGTDVVAGMTLTYDDHVALITEEAVIGVIPRDPAQMTAANLQSISINGADCADTNVLREDLEIVSNSIAADEDGGIYVVTSHAMYKFQWDGTTLSQAWQASYEVGTGMSSIRLGAGSGSTPSLMGTAVSDDRFVVITDGQDVMHLVLFWRDGIPADWPGLPGKDPRIACEVPVTFGDPSASETLSEQSVNVRGYSAVLVNDLLQDESVFDGQVPIIRNLLSALEGGNPAQAPYGAERIDWDPVTRTCNTVWTNTTVSLPNGIPSMSEATGLFYALGQRNGVWGIEGLDFATGASLVWAPASATTCPQEAIDSINPLIAAIVAPVLQRLPGSCENSVYAGTEVGPEGSIIQGTFQGASKYQPDTVFQLTSLRKGNAGVRQGFDFADRGLLELPADPDAALRWVHYGVQAVEATTSELQDAVDNDPSAPPETQGRLDWVRVALAKFEKARDRLGKAVVTQADIDEATLALTQARDNLIFVDSIR